MGYEKNEELMFVNGEKDRHPLTAMGCTKNNKLIILMTEGRNPGIAEGITLLQEATILKSSGCVEAPTLTEEEVVVCCEMVSKLLR